LQCINFEGYNRDMIEWKIENDLIPYENAVEVMEKRIEDIRAGHAPEMVWLLQHPSLYTAGTSAKEADLLDSRFPVHKSGRGGEYTYHGPGQRVAYVMVDLKRLQGNVPDVRAYVCALEGWIINTLAEFNIKGERRSGRVGIWVDQGGGRENKIAAIGLRIRRWVTYHGIAINVNPDLSHFSGIVPCGIKEHGVTSMHALGQNIDMAALDDVLQQNFPESFNPPPCS
jgi:lipoyl(octanoyl) transferase